MHRKAPPGSDQRPAFECNVKSHTLSCAQKPLTVEHGFSFTPSFSFFADCSTEQEIERLAKALGEGGEVLTPLGN